MLITLSSVIPVQKKDEDDCALQQQIYLLNIAFVVTPSVEVNQTISVETFLQASCHGC